MRTIGSLFSGIGGLELGLERAELGSVVWQVEIEPVCRNILARHWPNAGRFEDVRHVGKHNLERVDVVCGGFPCQNLSHANKATRSGLAGEKSGLWSEYSRVVDEIDPFAVIVENVSIAWNSWGGVVCGDLLRKKYLVAAVRIDAADVGAPQGRPRAFVLAVRDPHGYGQSAFAEHAQASGVQAIARLGGRDWRMPAPERRRVADGVSAELDTWKRLSMIGNAVVPAAAEVAGTIVKEWLEAA